MSAVNRGLVITISGCVISWLYCIKKYNFNFPIFFHGKCRVHSIMSFLESLEFENQLNIDCSRNSHSSIEGERSQKRHLKCVSDLLPHFCQTTPPG